jgi:DNA-directed RNA polymerase specialized sigma24 family protein
MTTTPKKNPQWWDRKLDRSGRPIREDVRAAGHEVWPQVCRRARSMLGDDTEAAELLEASVESISRYLDQKRVPVFSANIAALLYRAFYCRAMRQAHKNAKVEAVGTTGDLAGLEHAVDQSADLDRDLDFRKIVQHLTPRSCRILCLRQAGHSWEDIASELGIAVSTAQNTFWREIKQVRLKLHLSLKF